MTGTAERFRLASFALTIRSIYSSASELGEQVEEELELVC